MMKSRLLSLSTLCFAFLVASPLVAQKPTRIDPWVITAEAPFPPNYYGVTVANGMIGIVSSAQPFQVKDVVLAGCL